MKADARTIERLLDAPSPDIILFLLHGPDGAGSRALADRFARATDAERIDLDGSMLARDPGRLADEAASPSLFGGRHYIRVQASADEAGIAVEGLLAGGPVINPVIVVTGALRATATTLKAAISSPAALAHASYPPDDAQAARIATSLARDEGLRISGDQAQRIASEAGGDRGRIARMVELLALSRDARPEAPQTLEDERLDALGSGDVEASSDALVEAVFAGAVTDAAALLAALGPDDRTMLLRSVQRRLFLLAAIRGAVDAGAGFEEAMEKQGKAIFWKSRRGVATAARLWTMAGLQQVADSLVEAEMGLRSVGPGQSRFDALLLRMAREAARRR